MIYVPKLPISYSSAIHDLCASVFFSSLVLNAHSVVSFYLFNAEIFSFFVVVCIHFFFFFFWISIHFCALRTQVSFQNQNIEFTMLECF